MAEPIDVWGNYRKGQQAVLAPQLAGLQQASGAVSLATNLAQMQREQAMRSELAASDGSQQSLAQISAKYASPGDILRSQTASMDLQQRIAATREATMARIQQSANLAEMAHQDRLGRMTDQRQKDAEIQRHNLEKEFYNRQALGISGQRLYYDTGMTPPAATPPPPAGAAPLTPQGPVPAPAAPAIAPPDVQAWIAQLNAGVPAAAARGANVQAQEVQPNGGTLLPTQSVVPSAPPPSAATPPAQAPAAAPAAQPSNPNAPTLADAPAGLTPRDQARWLLQRTRPSIYGTPGTLVTTANANLHGQEFLSTLQPAEQNTVKSIANYEAPLNQVSSLRTQARQEMLAAVKQYDPNFNMMKYPVRQAMVTEFAKGKVANNIVAIDQSINHMGTLWKLGDALQNNNIKAANALINFVKDQTGNPSVNNFATAKQAVGTELMRVFRQVNASEVETQAWEKRFSEANSPAQIKGAIQVGSKLLQGRIAAINNQWNRGMETTGGYPGILSPEAKDALQTFGGNTTQASPAATGTPAVSLDAYLKSKGF